MRRREFIAGLGSTMAWPVVGSAAGRPRAVHRGAHAERRTRPDKRRYSAFTQALADLGWTDGRNVRMDLHWGGGNPNRIRAVAQELVGLQPDIILTNGTPATVALQRETPTIPIVFANVADPVASGIVPRHDRPRGGAECGHRPAPVFRVSNHGPDADHCAHWF
jgi:putative ABC transport system substrate-binding protein